MVDVEVVCFCCKKGKAIKWYPVCDSKLKKFPLCKTCLSRLEEQLDTIATEAKKRQKDE